MTLKELELFALQKQDFKLELNEEIAKDVLEIIFVLFPFYERYKNDQRFKTNLELLQTLYGHLGKQSKDFKEILDTILKQFATNKNAFILNTIKNTLIMEKIPKYPGIGIEKITKKDPLYKVSSILGEIKVEKASQKWPLKQSLSGKLSQECFKKSLEFVKENPNWKVVLSYIPNYFYKGYYHAYLKNEEYVLDIARNMVLEKKMGEILLDGEIFKELTLEEIEREKNILREQIIGFRENEYLLGILTWYLDYQNTTKGQITNDSQRHL